MIKQGLAFGLGLSLAVLAWGCNGTVESAPDPIDNPAECPSALPGKQSCAEADGPCKYDVEGCRITFKCEGGEWAAEPSSCQPECGSSEADYCADVGAKCEFGDECGGEWWECGSDHSWSITYWDDYCCFEDCTDCPSGLPSDGEACDLLFDPSTCTYEFITACGYQLAEAVCGDDNVWHVDSPSCECADHATIEACEADSACRYLTSGCEDPALVASGCFAKDDCSADVPCPDGTTCTMVNANTCTLDPCVECVTVSVCQ